MLKNKRIAQINTPIKLNKERMELCEKNTLAAKAIGRAPKPKYTTKSHKINKPSTKLCIEGAQTCRSTTLTEGRIKVKGRFFWILSIMGF